MKTRILSGGFLLAILAVTLSARIPSATGQADAGKVCEERLITALNPAISTRLAERVPLNPRIDTLQGKTVYMVDLQWGGPEAAYSVFEEMRDWFAKNMPSVKTEIRRTSGGPFSSNDPALMKEIAEKKVDAVIIGIAG